MRFHQTLDTMLDSEHKVRILRFLCRKGGEWVGRRLAAELAMNPVTAHRALRDLHGASVLDFRKVGSHFLYSLRDDHYLVREVLRPLFEGEAHAQERLLDLLTREFRTTLRASVVSAAIYGSLSRAQERPTSDIDLLVLVSSVQAKQDVRDALDRVGETTMHTFGNPLALYLQTVREAQQKVRRGLPVFRNILHEHRLLWGRPLNEVLHGR